MLAALVPAALWSVDVPVEVDAEGLCAVVLAAAFWSVVLVLVEGAVVLEAAAFWSVVLVDGEVVLALLDGVVVLVAAAFWSVVLVEGAAAEVEVELEEGVVAGGFTGAFALSAAAPDGLLVVAAGALAVLWSVVGVVEVDALEVLVEGEVPFEGEAA